MARHRFTSSRTCALILGAALGLLTLVIATAIKDSFWRIAVEVTVLGCSAIAGGWSALANYRQQKVLQEWFDELARQLDLVASGNSSLCATPPKEIASGLHEVLLEFANRLKGLTEQSVAMRHAQTAAEIRARKSATLVEQFVAVVNAVPNPVFMISGAGQVLVANNAAKELFGFQGGQSSDMFGGGNDLFEELMQQIRTMKIRSGSLDWETRRAEGQVEQFKVLISSWSPHGDDNLADQYLTIVLQDLTPLSALRKRHAEFVSAVSHEMKAPLAGIRAYVELLADGDVEDDQTRDEFVSTIEAQIERLQRLIENLLNLARIEAGILKVKKQSYSLNEILEDAARIMRPHAEQKRIEFQCEFSPLYLSVTADRDLLLQAVINLLSNAIKYTPDGGRVVLRSRLQDESVVFEVEDTGVGLSPEDCQRIFERFYRVEAHKNMASGTGLGLPLTKHIVEDVHGGRINVHSVVGKGSIFVVEIPRAVRSTQAGNKLLGTVG